MIVPLNKTCYVIGDDVNVRAGYSTDDKAIGTKYYGDEVQVTGTVQKDGTDLGWYQISFNNATAYIFASFLSDTKPQTSQASAGTVSTQTNDDGNYAIGPLYGTQDPFAPGQVYCIYCGQYYPEGYEYDNHVCPRRDDAMAGYAIEPLDGTQDPLAQ